MNASPFWIMLLLVWGRLDNPMIRAAACTRKPPFWCIAECAGGTIWIGGHCTEPFEQNTQRSPGSSGRQPHRHQCGPCQVMRACALSTSPPRRRMPCARRVGQREQSDNLTCSLMGDPQPGALGADAKPAQEGHLQQHRRESAPSSAKNQNEHPLSGWVVP